MREAAEAGIQHVLLITSPSQHQLVRRYLEVVGDDQQPLLPTKIDLIVQAKPEGFGDAVARGKEFIAGEPFMVLLGDHVYIADPGAKPCAAQVADAFENYPGAAMVGVQPVAADELPRVGVPRGRHVAAQVYQCTDFVEKPDPATAEKRLKTSGPAGGQYLAHGGIYIFSPQIFDCLAALSSPESDDRELQLADAQNMLLADNPDGYFLCRINGRGYDTGTVANYVKAVAAFAEKK